MIKLVLFLVGMLFLSCSTNDNTNTLASEIQNEQQVIQEISETDQVTEEIEEVLPNDVLAVNNSTIEIVPNDPKAIMNMEQVEEEITPLPTSDESDFHTYADLSSFLQKYVSSVGRVNYAGIKNDIGRLNSLIKSFESNYPKNEWSKNQKLAYWINAYNLYTIKLIVDNYPVSSIIKITAKPWDKKFVELGGKTYSLNNIENDIIRKQFNEPRIHFALNCASKSCPVLYNKAFKASALSYQLTQQTKNFFTDKSKNDFSDPTNIKISKIFEWYKADFTKNGTVVDFINKYRTEKLKSPKIGYTEYSWELNK